MHVTMTITSTVVGLSMARWVMGIPSISEEGSYWYAMMTELDVVAVDDSVCWDGKRRERV
jgi:hypothetical protein